MSYNIIGYSVDLERMKSSTCGEVGTAMKNGKKYFVKKFNTPVEPDDISFSPVTRQKNQKVFDLFRKRKQRVNKTLREVAGLGGNIIFPIEEGVYKNHWFEFSEYIEDTIAIDQYTKIISSLATEKKVLALKIVMSALSTIHSQGLVHGDLKLSNIMLVNNKGTYVSKIIDFDGAFFEDDVPLESIISTPDYYSPELAIYTRNDDLEYREQRKSLLTTKSDIFTMGLVLHEYLTGTKPTADYLPEALRQQKDDGRFVYPWQIVFIEPDEGRQKPQLVISEKIKEPYLVALISEMINTEPTDRPSAPEIVMRLNSKQLPIYTDTWPEHSISFNEVRIRDQFIGMRQIEKEQKNAVPLHLYEMMEKNGYRRFLTAEQMVDEGYAVEVESWEDPYPEDNIVWNMDKLSALFYSIKRSDRPGLYILVDKSGNRRKITAKTLIMSGIACAADAGENLEASVVRTNGEEDLWSEDIHLKYNNELSSRFHILKKSIKDDQHGYLIEMHNGEKQFWKTNKCKMMNLLVPK